ncbi:hypothetical protein [Bacteroides sp.]|uniref:hypothetical protein n=1 Tax=Bacteroides sp. TaxID=29523 RepID=UPI00261FF357|nr:hypothetical protein [Bacteroides sp.]MDD3039093.1 hypothetical protein [Bacteroides sp.]
MNVLTDFGKAICPYCKTNKNFKKGPGPLFSCTQCNVPSTIEEFDDYQSYLLKNRYHTRPLKHFPIYYINCPLAFQPNDIYNTDDEYPIQTHYLNKIACENCIYCNHIHDNQTLCNVTCTTIDNFLTIRKRYSNNATTRIWFNENNLDAPETTVLYKDDNENWQLIYVYHTSPYGFIPPQYTHKTISDKEAIDILVKYKDRAFIETNFEDGDEIMIGIMESEFYREHHGYDNL